MADKFDSNSLNTDEIVMWFDDLGSGNEEYRFLSNFYEGDPITLTGVNWLGSYETNDKGDCVGFVRRYDDAYTHPHDPEACDPVEFATGEHAFAALKVAPARRTLKFFDIAKAESPSIAKHLGRTCDLRPDWEEVKYDAMCAVVRAKFTLDREEGERLLATGDKMLVEGTWWKDSVWGVDLQTEGLPGRNWLGTILMARRAELRAMSKFGSNVYVKHFGAFVGDDNALFAG